MKNYKLGCLMAMAGLFLFLGGCQKEEHISSSAIDREISKEEIIDFCESLHHNSLNLRTKHKTPLNVLPDFSSLVQSTNQFGHPVFIGKLDAYSLDTILKPDQYEGALIAFFKDSLGDIRSELMLWKQKPGTNFDQSYFLIYPQSHFTGINILINDKDRIEKIGAYKNGMLTGYKNLTLAISGRSIYDFMHTSARCVCSGCDVSWLCNILCAIQAVVLDGLGAVGDGFSWLGDEFSNIYYWWADGGFKDSNWWGDPGPGNSGFSGGSWGGTWGNVDGDHGGTSSGGIGSWHIEQIKCRAQLFNEMEGNGDIIDLQYPDLCTLHNLLNLSDCAYQYLYEDPALVFEISNFFASKSNSDKAKELINEYLKALCLSGGNGNTWNLNEMNTLYCINTHSTTNEDKAVLLYFYYNSNLLDPCTGKPLDKDQIFFSMCSKGNVNIAGLDATLAEQNYIDDLELASNCPCVYAIWKQMKNKIFTSSVNQNICINDIMGDFLEGPLQAEIGISQFSLGDINAKTLPNTTLGGNLLLFNTRIEIDKDICNGNKKKDAIEIAGTFLHEFVHARIFEHLYQLGYLSNLPTPSFNEAWKLFVQSHYSGLHITESHHQIMAQAFVKDIAAALHELNGGQGNPSDYLIFAWQGLEKAFTDEQKVNFEFIPDFDLLRNNYNQNVKGKGPLADYNCN